MGIMMGKCAGTEDLAVLTVVWPLGEHCSVIVALRGQERSNNPPRSPAKHLTPWVSPTQPELVSCPPYQLSDPEVTPLGIAGAVGVLCNSSQEQDGENQYPGSCRSNFLAQIPLLLEIDFLNVANRKKFSWTAKDFADNSSKRSRLSSREICLPRAREDPSLHTSESPSLWA